MKFLKFILHPSIAYVFEIQYRSTKLFPNPLKVPSSRYVFLLKIYLFNIQSKASKNQAILLYTLSKTKTKKENGFHAMDCICSLQLAPNSPIKFRAAPTRST